MKPDQRGNLFNIMIVITICYQSHTGKKLMNLQSLDIIHSKFPIIENFNISIELNWQCSWAGLDVILHFELVAGFGKVHQLSSACDDLMVVVMILWAAISNKG